MSPPCSAPVAWETLVAYWAGELPAPELDALEEHLVSCPACTAASARVAAVTEAIRALLPPVIDRAGLARLRARGFHIVENPVTRGERRECVFAPEVDILLHRLGGLRLHDATTVAVKVLAESSRDTLLDLQDVPFDRDSGEILVACQRHFAAFPHDVLFEVSTHLASGAVERVSYAVPHRFAS